MSIDLLEAIHTETSKATSLLGILPLLSLSRKCPLTGGVAQLVPGALAPGEDVGLGAPPPVPGVLGDPLQDLAVHCQGPHRVVLREGMAFTCVLHTSGN